MNGSAGNVKGCRWCAALTDSTATPHGGVVEYVVTLQLAGDRRADVSSDAGGSDQPPTFGGGTVVMVIEPGLSSSAAADATVPSVTLAPGEPVVAETLFARAEASGRGDRVRVFRADV
jgi:hypothetical protein